MTTNADIATTYATRAEANDAARHLGLPLLTRAAILRPGGASRVGVEVYQRADGRFGLAVRGR